MTETLGSTASCSTMTRSEWFEDSSSEGDAPIRFRLIKKGGGKKKSTLSMSSKNKARKKKKVELDIEQNTGGRMALRVSLKKKKKKEKKKIVQKVEKMVKVEVVVKIALKDFVSSKGTLTAHVARAASKGEGLSASGQSNKKGKWKAENWRRRPVRSGVFQRTLPGELSRVIIVATKVTSTAKGDADTNSACLPGEGPPSPEELLCDGKVWKTVRKTRTLKTVKAARQIIRETEGSDVDLLRAKTRSWKTVKAARKTLKESAGLAGPLLRQHPSLSLASHNQVANVIAKCLPLRSVKAFLFQFNSFRPPPLQRQKRQKRKKSTTGASVPADTMASAPASRLAPASLPFCDETIGKTPVEWVDSALKHAFGNDHVMLKRCQHPDEMYSLGESHSDLDVVVMDCILSRGRPVEMYIKKKCKDASRDAPVAPVQACMLDDVDAVNLAIAVRDGNALDGCPSAKSNGDEFYRACIVILPQAGVFYCHRERRSLLTGVLNSHVPMDINWLRLRRDSPDNCFGNGSFVSRLANAKKCSIWKWSIRRSATNFLPFPDAIPGLRPRSLVRVVHRTRQLMDEEGPGLPPDYIVGEGDNLSNADEKCRAKTFQEAFSRSMSARLGGRHYAPGFLHMGQNIDPLTTWVIDPKEFSELDLECYVTILPSTDGQLPFERLSVVQIRYLPHVVGSGCEELLTDINRHCRMVSSEKGSAGARAGNGDLGGMHPIGSRIDKSWNNVQYVTSSSEEAVPVLSKAVEAASILASVAIPAALRVMQDFENDAGMQHAPGMEGGECRVTLSMDLSINLANSTHYDINDASQGFSIWTEDYPGSTGQWYFVLPNMKGKFPGTDREYNGIAIKLSDGVLIGWDGRLIRHGTSMVGSRVGNIYGTFFAAKTRIIQYGMSQLPQA